MWLIEYNICFVYKYGNEVQPLLVHQKSKLCIIDFI